MNEPVIGRVQISMSCWCDPPKTLTSGTNPRCEKCGMEIVIGSYDAGPRLRLIEGGAA